jgi:hypothetical protein
MPAAWQASGTLLGSTGADISPVPPAHAVNDIFVLAASSRVVTETLTTPSGYTLLGGPTDATAWRTYFYWRRATSAAEGNPLLDWNAAVGEKYGQIHTIRGALGDGNPFASTGLGNDVTDPIVTAGVTSGAPYQLIVVVGIGSDNLATTVTVTSTDPATYDLNHYSDIATGNDAAGWCASKLRAAAGATGNVTSDFDAALPAAGVMVLAVKDAQPPFVGMARART